MEERGFLCFLLPGDALALGLDIPTVETEGEEEEIDLAIVLGGDGTMLRAADVVRGKDVPIVGFNIGKIGFLTAGEIEEIENALEKITEGKHVASKRMQVGCVMEFEGKRESYIALNEIVVGKRLLERLIHLSVYINDEFLMKYSGDGLIVSSATGSTAYSLSAGGPIVKPELECFLLTPICPHMLFSRPMVLGKSDKVRVKIDDPSEEVSLSIDGHMKVDVRTGANMEFFAEEKTIEIIQLTKNYFLEMTRNNFLGVPEN
ncbi:MAG: NAD(+)/NADH kinase [Actinomycetota bacterium]|nr:NAD(+)/NADH kinase [Actinomycetota bacterium]